MSSLEYIRNHTEVYQFPLPKESHIRHDIAARLAHHLAFGHFYADFIQECWLFGSSARGEATRKSDIDIALILNECLSLPVKQCFDEAIREIITSQGYSIGMGAKQIQIQPLFAAEFENPPEYCRDIYENSLKDRIILVQKE